MGKLTDCFLLDNTMGTMLPLYETQEKGYHFFATRYGFSRQTGRREVMVPMFPFTDVEVEDRCAILLLEAIRATGWKRGNPYKEAEFDFNKRDLRFQNLVSSADHHLIPLNRSIAVGEPEFLGRIVVSNEQRGVVLFNPNAVIGYKKRGTTCFEHILGDLLS